MYDKELTEKELCWTCLYNVTQLLHFEYLFLLNSKVNLLSLIHCWVV